MLLLQLLLLLHQLTLYVWTLKNITPHCLFPKYNINSFSPETVGTVVKRGGAKPLKSTAVQTLTKKSHEVPSITINSGPAKPNFVCPARGKRGGGGGLTQLSAMVARSGLCDTTHHPLPSPTVVLLYIYMHPKQSALADC